MKRPALKLPIRQFTNNRNAVTPIQRDRCQIENRTDGRITAQPDQINGHAAEAKQPHRVDGRVGAFVDFEPDPGQGKEFVAGESPDGAGAGLDGRHGGEVEDEAGRYGEEDSAFAADVVVENLGDGLFDAVSEGVRRIAAAVGKDDGVEPSSYPGEAQG